ncbi:MAG: bifunctional 5,10-methylenetetrahydrofolate dehydrogenase/5,10-methenyltetrahydrofolate cyclohydrolase [Lachnospiraceae bacterium]|nr:bifunctional 5,10-methylenetetrahydrofolate dehydrogenase/5,10-methenyltetrahydrofolate cyclohydrolase [Lachnospiraceae bacterium]
MSKELSGKKTAEALDSRNRQKVEELRLKGIVPCLAILRCGEDPSDMNYERGALKKASLLGIETRLVTLPEDVSSDRLKQEIEKLNQDSKVHGVLMFRPLPKGLRPEEEEIINTLDSAKDVDGMTYLSNAGVYAGSSLGFPPCTPEAVMEILSFYGYDLTGKKVTVIGRSLVVGKPVAMMLIGANATVTVCHTRTVNVPQIAREADIIVTAAGVLNSLTKDFVRPGQTVIDVGINWDPEKNDGKGGISGDVCFNEVSSIVSALTPVPGGVGSVTTSVLMWHVIEAAFRIHGQEG